MKFTIETVSKMTGIPAPSLRNWEKRYGFPKPQRTGSGHRFYGSDDVEFLKQAWRLVEQGHLLSEISQLYQKCMQEKQSLVRASQDFTNITDDVTYRVELLHTALERYDHIGIQQHFGILNAKLSPEQLFDRVFEVILKRAAEDWEQARISIAQENYITSFIRLKLAAFLALELPVTSDHRILAATMSIERNSGGLMLLAAHLKFKGYRVEYFDTALPADDLKLLVDELRPSVVTLSYLHFDQFLAGVESVTKIKCPVIVSGCAVRENSHEIDRLKANLPIHIRFCQKKVGSEAAEFVELICQSKRL